MVQGLVTLQIVRVAKFTARSSQPGCEREVVGTNTNTKLCETQQAVQCSRKIGLDDNDNDPAFSQLSARKTR